MRVVGVVAIFGSLLAGPSLRAEPRGPDASISGPERAGSRKGAAAAPEGPSSTPSDLALYGKADQKQPPIGTITKDTELYVLDVVVGWASVLPKQLDVVPIGDRHFWVRASELGL